MFTQRHLPRIVMRLLKAAAGGVDNFSGLTDADLENVLIDAYAEIDATITRENAIQVAENTGCTAITCLYSEHTKKLYFANCGDSRAIVGTKAGTVRFGTHDHKPASPRERSRIEA